MHGNTMTVEQAGGGQHFAASLDAAELGPISGLAADPGAQWPIGGMSPGIEAGNKKNGVEALRLGDGTIDPNAPATARFDRCALDGERPPVIEVPLGKPIGDEQGLARRRQAEM